MGCDDPIKDVAKNGPDGPYHVKCLAELNPNFIRALEDIPPSSETGRFFIRSQRTGKLYCVEPIGDPHIGWGDVDVVTKKVTGNYGDKHPGTVTEKDSIIKEEYGFKNIKMLEPGSSPLSAIEEIDAQYPSTFKQ